MIRPPLPRSHMRRHQLRSHVDGLEIDLDGPAPVLERVVEDGARRGIDRGVVDQDVDLAKLLDHVTHGATIGVVISDIEFVGRGRTASGIDLRSDGSQGSWISLQQRNLGAFACHLKRDRAAETLPRAADNANSSRQ